MRLLALLGCSLIAGPLPAGDDIPESNGADTVAAVHSGELPNGLRYFLQNHSEPGNADGVEVRLVVKVGSLHEREGERGFAHLVEHLAFSGTEEFSEDQLDKALLDLNVASGQHRNAFTSHDNTFYLLNLPEGNGNTLDVALRVLSNWAFRNTFDNRQVKREVKVVEQERQLRGEALPDADEAWADLLLKGTAMADRSPIGATADLAAATPARLRDFYQRWYRPDRMALIVVGKFRKTKTEEQIYHYFNVPTISSEALADPETLRFNNQRTLGIVPDANVTIPSARMDILLSRELQNDEDWYLSTASAALLASILQNRFAHRLDGLGEEFVDISVDTQRYSDYGSLFRLQAFAGEQKLPAALTLLQTELLRACRFGFQPDEVAFARRTLVSEWQTWGSNYAGSYIAQLITSIQSHFLYDYPLPPPQEYVANSLDELRAITIDDLQQDVSRLCSGENAFRAAGVTLPLGLTKRTALSEQSLEKALSDADNATLKPMNFGIASTLRLPGEDGAGYVDQKETYSPMSLSVLTLNNGVKVVLAPAKFKGDIYYSAVARGGLSTVPGANKALSYLAQETLEKSPPSGMTVNQYRQYLIDKGIAIDLSIAPNFHGLQGHFPHQHMSEALRLIAYLLSRHRPDPVVFARHKTTLLTHYQNIDNAPDRRFGIGVNRQLYSNTPVYLEPDASQLQNVTLQQVEQLYDATFGAPGNINIILSGAFGREDPQAMVGRILGQLPKRSAQIADVDTRFYPGEPTALQVMGNPNNRTDIHINFQKPLKHWNWQAEAEIKALGRLLGMEVYKRVRQEEGLVYAANGYGEAYQAPYAYTNVGLDISTGPENSQRVLDLFWEVVELVKQEGFGKDQMDAVKSELLVEFRGDLGNVRSYMGLLMECLLREDWFHSLWKYPDGLERVNNEHLKSLAQMLLQREQALIATYEP